MISTDSRYIDSRIVVVDNVPHIVRVFPAPIADHYLYTWKESDRLDYIAARFLGDPKKWWQILDINPLIQDPNDIRPGDQIRVPKHA